MQFPRLRLRTLTMALVDVGLVIAGVLEVKRLRGLASEYRQKDESRVGFERLGTETPSGYGGWS